MTSNTFLVGPGTDSAELRGGLSLHADTLYQQIAERTPKIWPVLMLIAKAAEQRGWSLYIVGGAVRDLLLDLLGDSQSLTDIDLVVEEPSAGAVKDAAQGTEKGAGVVLAEAIRAEYAEIETQVHGQFQTAVLTWQSWQIDIATARKESYPYPAANPEVHSSSIHQDLCRRDFTINAMALALTGAQPGQLLDLFNGQLDLQQRFVRVLHVDSFIDDPTRIFRAVRFSVRLGFELEAQTEQLIRTAVSSGVYARSRSKYKKVPALQSRLKAELKYLLEETGWEKSLIQLNDLGALICLDDHLTITSELLRQLRRMERWIRKFEVDQPRWLLMLELVLAQLETDRGDRVAHWLDLGVQSQHRLHHVHVWEAHLIEQSQKVTCPSEVYELLRSHSRAELLLMADRHPHTLGPSIWHYIIHLAAIPALINGATLKRLGYSPGPQFKKILTDIHHHQLDGKLTTAKSAEQYILARYSKSEL
ncbi:MAG: hypothetical protein WA949_05470 [Phormidesmis sp.]